MSVILRMPEVLTGMSEGILTTWLAAPGDHVAVGQPLVEVETEKAMVEYQAEVAGMLAGYLVDLGAPVAVGAPIAVLAEPGETAQRALAAAGGHDTDPAGAPSVAALPDADQPAESEQPSAQPQRRFASPLVRRLARELRLDLRDTVGTGPGGRIVRRDLDRAVATMSTSAQQPQETPDRVTDVVPVATTPWPTTDVVLVGPAPRPTTDVVADQPGPGPATPSSRMRRSIARRMVESKTTVPHFYLVADCHVDALLRLRADVNASLAKKVSLNDFVVKAVAGALRDVPEVNVFWNGIQGEQRDVCDIAVAVAVDGGLVAPVIHGVDAKSLVQVSETIWDLAQRGRAGRLQEHELSGGTFTVSNLGMHGVRAFAAIINPPHAGILAVGAASARPIVEDGQVTLATVMTVTLSGDHRMLDGVVGARWLSAFVARIESPLTILA